VNVVFVICYAIAFALGALTGWGFTYGYLNRKRARETKKDPSPISQLASEIIPTFTTALIPTFNPNEYWRRPA
jgi:hypothetical protein